MDSKAPVFPLYDAGDEFLRMQHVIRAGEHLADRLPVNSGKQREPARVDMQLPEPFQIRVFLEESSEYLFCVVVVAFVVVHLLEGIIAWADHVTDDIAVVLDHAHQAHPGLDLNAVDDGVDLLKNSR